MSDMSDRVQRWHLEWSISTVFGTPLHLEEATGFYQLGTLTFIFQLELTSGPTTIYAASSAVSLSLSPIAAPIEPVFTFWLVSVSSIERPDSRIVVDHCQIDSLVERHILLFDASALFPIRCAHIGRYFLLTPTSKLEEKLVFSIFNLCVNYFVMPPSFLAQAKLH